MTTPNGQFWHRYSHDGYGETLDGGPFPGPGNTGRCDDVGHGID